MGERVKIGEWWEVYEGPFETGAMLVSHFPRDKAHKFARDMKGAGAIRVVHVARYRGKRPTCDACGAEIGACPKDCDSRDEGHGFAASDFYLPGPEQVWLCHGCGAYPEPEMTTLVARVNRRRAKTPAAAGEEGSR